mmetsp:Transcript_15400/g.21056  ORF Transcript_15400/g.21056 Transcript_15400/m.21056 type:complete len:139 (-) Transcript_15400:137-553(-)
MAQPHAEHFIQQQMEEINSQQNRLGKSHPDVANSMNVLALYFHHVIRNHQEALSFHTQAMDILKAQPVQTCDVEIAVTMVDIGNVYRATGKNEQAVSHFMAALRIFRENKVPETHPAVCGATQGVCLLQRTDELTRRL